LRLHRAPADCIWVWVWVWVWKLMLMIPYQLGDKLEVKTGNGNSILTFNVGKNHIQICSSPTNQESEI
jgi:hypothetical protein